VSGERDRVAAMPDVPYASHEVRLSGRQCLLAGAIVTVVLALLPGAWKRVEAFRPGADYRVPYALSTDYWLFDRYSRTARGDDVLVVGDSVVWGQYVAADQTLAAQLGRLVPGRRFVNLGVDGLHPAAMAGLLRFYGRGIRQRPVLLQCNLLWMSSPRRDLQTAKEFRFNHPTLVPQFFPRIPCYRCSWSGRLDAVVQRSLPLFAWTKHLRLAYLGGKGVPQWSIEHPYRVPFGEVKSGLPEPGRAPRHEAVPWAQKGLGLQDFPWVELESSFQWARFCKAVGILRDRGNRVFVLVGPFNEHMLAPASRERYVELKRGVVAWLHEEGVPYLAPDALPSELYADASHPLARGYALLARELADSAAFQGFLRAGGSGGD